MQDSLYLFTEDATNSYEYEEYLTDHPGVLGCLGFVPEGDWIDKTIMRNTLDSILSIWNWETCWGWDFPLAAINATALDQPGNAIDLLMMDTPKNSYLPNGHNFQNEVLRLYLPGNGGLLTAVAFMCTHQNQKGGNGFSAPGWQVKYENLSTLHPTKEEYESEN